MYKLYYNVPTLADEVVNVMSDELQETHNVYILHEAFQQEKNSKSGSDHL
jgi:hypothetical protein